MIIYSGLDIQAKEYKSLSDHFSFQYIGSAEEAGEKKLLENADVFLLGTGSTDPVRETQNIYAADKRLSIVVLTNAIDFKRVKQLFQLAPFVGKNVLIVAQNPELDLISICKNAAARTLQKRSFFKLNLTKNNINSTTERTKLAQMGNFLEYAPIGAILLSQADRIVNYNQQAKKLLTSLQYLNIELTVVFSQKETDIIKSFVHNGHRPDLRLELKVEKKILEFSSTEVYTEEGEKHFLILFNDITNQRLEAERIQRILEGLPQMAWTTNPDGAVTFFTQSWYFYTGQTMDEALGSGWSSVIFPDDMERLNEQWQYSLTSGKPFQQAARYKNIKGEYRWHLARASAIKNTDGEITMWVGTSTDIHDQILLTEELERKVKERTHSLEVSNSELEQFAHVSSHDLQEPLRKIRTFAELIKNNDYQNMGDNSKRYIDKINATAERMSDLLKALLNFTKLHREETFAVVNLNEIVDHIFIDLELMIAQKKADIRVSELPTLKAIPIQMQQLFYNLINNALKFSKKDNPPIIEISFKYLQEEELSRFTELQKYKPYYEIIVKDNGIGFNPSHANKIFQVFQRLHTKSEYEGSGIGLSLVKKVVSNHKGVIYALSIPGEGTSFHIILPVNQ